jgi:succinyl-diaminopimelate desuccinylase
MLTAINDTPLDQGTIHFQPSTVAITSIDVGNPATNVIPARATARINVRFNDLHTGDDIDAWLRQRCQEAGGSFTLATDCSGEAFLCPPGRLSERVVRAVFRETGRVPQLSTSGGTSDARFIKDYCPVCEFGMAGATAHKVDENVALSDIETLTRIYETVLLDYFAADG